MYIRREDEEARSKSDAGKEIANGFSELNDPEEQSVRFNNQVKSKVTE